MKEYIEREAALKWQVPHYSTNGVEIIEGKAIPVEYIENLPAADVVEKKHNFIDGANLASKIAGHSYYHGDAILSAIFTLMNGKDGIASIKPADEIKLFYAHWIWDGYDYEKPWACSKCRYHSENGTSYCPNCGAKMEDEHIKEEN